MACLLVLVLPGVLGGDWCPEVIANCPGAAGFNLPSVLGPTNPFNVVDGNIYLAANGMGPCGWEFCFSELVCPCGFLYPLAQNYC